jgi:aldose 1-epimerase
VTRQIALHNESLQLHLEPDIGGICTALRWHPQGQPAVDILRTQPAGAINPFEASCFVMAPYSNRLFGGHLLTPAGTLRLPVNHRDIAHPVHGLGWRRPWHVVEQSKTFTRLRYSHIGDAHWPFAHSCTQTITLKGDSAFFELVLRNNSSVAMPAGVGLHPCLALESSANVCFKAKRVWNQDPNGHPLTASTEMLPRFNFHVPRPAMGEGLNHCFSDWNGKATVDRPDLQLTVLVRASRNLRHLMVYRKPDEPWLCLEPVSHATGAFSVEALHNPANGARTLAPKQTMRVWVEIRTQAHSRELAEPKVSTPTKT